jgi:hypothetical protein
MKLVSHSIGDPVVCDLSDDRADFACPPVVRVARYQSREKVGDEWY